MWKRPVTIVAVCWILGAWAALSDMETGLWPVGVAAALILIFTGMPSGESSGRELFRVGLLGVAVFFLSLVWSTGFDLLNRTQITDRHWENIAERTIRVNGHIASDVRVDGDRVSFVLELKRIELPGRALTLSSSFWQKERVQVFLYVDNREEQEAAKEWKRGAEAELAGLLEKPGPARNFGAFEYGRYLRYQGIHWVFRAETFAEVGEPSGHGLHRLFQVVDDIRTHWGEQTNRLYPPELSGWIQSMTTGMREDLDPEVFEQFSMIGMTHILAISGLHVGLFLALLAGILKWFRATRETVCNVSMSVLPLYMLVTGAAPSVLRAGLMAMIGLYAWKKGLLKDGLNILGGTAVLLLAWHPYYLFDVGFQLSFAVTLGLMVLVPKWNRLLPIRHVWLKNAVTVTLAAQAVSFPLTAYYFNQMSVMSWLANLLLVPLISFGIWPASVVSVAISGFSPEAGMWMADRIIPVGRGILGMIETVNSWEWTRFSWMSPPLWWLFLYFAALYVLTVSLEKDRVERTAFLPPAGIHSRSRNGVGIGRTGFPGPAGLAAITVFALLVLLLYGYDPRVWQHYGEVQFIDVGQGDAILIRTPADRTLLVDGGGTFRWTEPGEEWKERKDPFEVGKDVLVPLLKKRGVQQLDAVILSHHDFDHVGGLASVLERMPVKRLLFNGALKDSEYVKELYREALKRNIEIIHVEAGDEWRPDPYTEIRFLYPSGQSVQAESIGWEEEQNEHSVVFWMRMHESRFLLTGDIHREQEADILSNADAENGENTLFSGLAPVDVMKVAHHGSKTSTSGQWLSFWRPSVSVISAGRNNLYGHPHAEVLQRLERLGSTVYRTDLNGEVQFRVFRDSLKVRTKLH